MPIRIKCPECGKALKVKDEFAGKKGKCPSCGQILLIPPSETVPEQDGLLEVQAPSRPSLVRPSLPARSVQRPRAKTRRQPIPFLLGLFVAGHMLIGVGGLFGFVMVIGLRVMGDPGPYPDPADVFMVLFMLLCGAFGVAVYCRRPWSYILLTVHAWAVFFLEAAALVALLVGARPDVSGGQRTLTGTGFGLGVLVAILWIWYVRSIIDHFQS